MAGEARQDGTRRRRFDSGWAAGHLPPAARSQRVPRLGLRGSLAVRAGGRVAYLGPNGIATFETLFAVASLRAIFVPLNTRLAAPEIAYMLDDTDPAVLIVAPELEQLAATALTRSSTAAHVMHLQAAAVVAGYEAAIQDHAGSLPARPTSRSRIRP
ncbi:MAG: AMP-binding protein [Streptosporangiaceae bacterium]